MLGAYEVPRAGGTWYPLRVPAGTRCPTGSKACQLNLFGPSDSMFGRFYSWYDAVGLMIGTGTIGTYTPRPFRKWLTLSQALKSTLMVM